MARGSGRPRPGPDQGRGLPWVKQLFSWQDIEGAGKGQYDWTKPDRIVDQVEKHDLKLIVRISQDPDRPFWAGNPPDNAGDFADFLAAVASRYTGRIQAYQVWNEPNLAREWGNKRPDPTGYARMLQDGLQGDQGHRPERARDHRGHGAHRHRHRRGDARHQVLRADVPGDGRQQRRLLRHARRPCGRLCGRAGDLSPDETAAKKVPYGGERFFAFRHVEDVRAIMERYGDQDKRVAILEFGWTTDNRPDSPYYWHGAGAGIDEATQGASIWCAPSSRRGRTGPRGSALMTVIYMPDADWTKDTEQYYWSIIGPGYPDLFLRAAYVELCIYLNKLTRPALSLRRRHSETQRGIGVTERTTKEC